MISVVESLSGAWGCMRSPMAAKIPRMCRSALDDLSGTFKNEIGAIFAAVMQSFVATGLMVRVICFASDEVIQVVQSPS